MEEMLPGPPDGILSVDTDSGEQPLAPNPGLLHKPLPSLLVGWISTQTLYLYPSSWGECSSCSTAEPSHLPRDKATKADPAYTCCPLQGVNRAKALLMQVRGQSLLPKSVKIIQVVSWLKTQATPSAEAKDKSLRKVFGS